jgi:hypothetical protein
LKSNRSIVFLGIILFCVCLFFAGIALVYFYFRNQPPSTVTNNSGYYIRGSKVYYLGGFPSTAFELEGADVRTFEILDDSQVYARDQGQVYFNGHVIPDADPATFELLDSPYSKDSRHVYVSGEIFTDDPVTFEIVSGNIMRDAQHIYWSTSIISDDPTNLVVLGGENYYTYLHDSTTVFVNGNPIPDADPASFEIIMDGYSRDASHIFYFNEILPEADSASFEVLESPFSRDVDSVFWMENVISGADPATFKVLNADFECSADANVAFYQDQAIPNFDPNSVHAGSQVTNCDSNGLYFSP